MNDNKPSFWQRFREGLKDASIKISLEADLYPIGGSRWGEEPIEIEYTEFDSGRIIVSIEVEQKLKVPVGDEISICINGSKFRDIKITGYHQDIRLNSTEGDSIPTISLGDTAIVQHNEVSILEGKFKRD